MPRIAVEPVIVLQPEGIEIPAGITSLERFRAWVRSEAFPERGRIDWVAGRLEVDMAPEDVFTHGTPKSAIAGKLIALLQESEKGLVFIDKTRISSSTADLSAEPDVLVILDETLESGRVKLVPKASGEEGRYVEVEGSPDLVVECVSDSSVKKDTKLFRELYHAAGAREYWIIDARREKVDFKVLCFRKDGFVEARRDSAGCLHSEVLGRRVRLVRSPKRSGAVYFRLELVGG
ncbi:MAG: Uma2 family endonuclease [Planctomycetes bacterium]|nr:Uma2 family endonuclease [Planctomycetota bacterium]